MAKKQKEEIVDSVQWDIEKPTDIKSYPSPTTNIVRDNKGRVTVGSRGLNTKFTLQEIEERFIMAAEAAYGGQLVSVEEAMTVAGLLPSTWYRYAKDYGHIGELTEAIKVGIRAHVNREAIEGRLQPIVSVFRLKCLGDIEAGKQTVTEEVKEQPIIDLGSFS